MQVQRF